MNSVWIVIPLLCFCGFKAASIPAVADPPLRICAFNIQVFGLTKMKNTEVVSVLVKILLSYDLILVQEIRDSSQEAFKVLLTILNIEVARIEDPRGVFGSITSDRLGRTDSKEQYGFLFRESLLQVTAEYQYPEELNIFERPPFVVRFQSKTTEIDDFGILALHTKPSQALSEIDNIITVYNIVSKKWNLKDILIAGDLNSDCTYLQDQDHDKISLYNDHDFKWLIGDDVDTTTGNSECSYDRFIAAGTKLQSAVVPHSAKVVKFDEIYNLSDELTVKVSDHYPIEVMLAGKANILLQSKVKDSKSVETTSTVPVSSVYRIRDLYKASIPKYTVTILKEGTKQSLIVAETVLQSFQDTITEIQNFQLKFPELVTPEMEAMIIPMMKSDSFLNDYVYGFENLKPSYKMKISCVMSTLLCTLRIEKDFG